MSEEDLERAEKRREAKGEKEIYTHLNAEFQRIAKRNMKILLHEQCKETEESNRVGKAKDVFKKNRDTKEMFHEKMGTIKERNGMDLTKAEVIRKSWQEYLEELYQKDHNDPGVITHLDPDILECKVRWTLGSIIANKASGGDGIPIKLFQILRDDAVKVLHSIC